MIRGQKPGRQSEIANQSGREQAKGNPRSRRHVRVEIRQSNETRDNAGKLRKNTQNDLAGIYTG